MKDYNTLYKSNLELKEVAILQDKYIQSLEELTELQPKYVELLRLAHNLTSSNKQYEAFKISVGINFDNLMDKVCIVFDESKRDVMSQRRDREFVTPRHLFCYIAMEYMPLATPKEIASYLGRDRSTIYNNMDAANSLLLYDKSFRQQYSEVKNLISQL